MATAHDFYLAMQGERVRFLVGTGSEAQDFLIPLAIVEEFSFMIEAILRASNLGTVWLPDDAPIAFECFHEYVYHRDVAFPDLDNVRARHRGNHEREFRMSLPGFITGLCETWMFGDKYGIPGLQNCAMYKLCQVLRSGDRGMAVNTMCKCYEDTEPGAKLRNLVVDYVVCSLEQDGPGISTRCLINKLSTYPGFAADLYEAQRAWYEMKESEKFWEMYCPRYLKPLKYAERYEVEVSDAEKLKIPASSCAVWRADGLNHRCEDCGWYNSAMCCQASSGDGTDSKCVCGKHDAVPLCSSCQKHRGLLD